MMGERAVAQEALLYSFNLERHVPSDHLLRSIDRFVTCRISATICGRSIARRDALRSIPS